MGIEDTIQPLSEWLLPIPGKQFGGLLTYLIALVTLIVAGLIVGFILSTIRNGPFEAFYSVFGTAVKAVPELLAISPRRVWAMSWLAFQEAIRKKALIVFALFMVVLLFAGWFVNPSADQPVRLYLSLVLTLPKLLVLLLVIALSVFSLPDDIKRRTIYTIFTKPVLPSELFLGRLFGFVAVGTLVLVVMGFASYIFLLQGFSHTHYVNAADLTPLQSEEGALVGYTTVNAGHRHQIKVYPDGFAEVDRVNEHSHDITVNENGGPEDTYVIGGPTDMFQARVRHIGTVKFLDRSGKNASPRGINVGKEWEYFSYVEGGTFGAAIFTFEDISQGMLTEVVDGDETQEMLPVEFNLSVFRTYKGIITSGIRGNYYFRNPVTEARSVPIPFTAKEESDLHYIPRKLSNADADSDKTELDLIDDLTAEDGRLELWIQCDEPGQYFGVAQNTVYILEDNRSFLMNYIKCYVGMWFEVVLVITFGLVFSTFLNGPVALLASFLALGYGSIADDVKALARNVIFHEKTGWYGGGPAEAMVRLFQQQNIMTELGDATWVQIVKAIDTVFACVIYSFVNMLPDYGMFDTSGFVVDGYNIPGAVVAEQAVTVIGFLIALVAVGYVFLKSKEIAA
ncbi:hypothetical protein GC197_14815 [bacterium]|nr:hypothetical protein [bacterium]